MNKIIYALIILLMNQSLVLPGWFHQNSGVNHNLHSVNFNHGNENHAWACGDNGTILYTSNGGINWILQNSGTSSDLYAVVFMEISGGPVFVCGENGIMLRTSDNGNTWSSINSGVNVTLRDISDFNFVAVGDSGVILKSSDNGLNWNLQPSPTKKNLYAVSASFQKYIAGEDGTILRGTGTGSNWSMLMSGVTNDLFGVPLFGNSDITVGSGGLILRSTNFGSSWYSQNSMTIKNINSTEYSVNNTSRIYCAGDSGLILKTTDYGNQWWFQHSGTSEDLNSIFFYLDDNTGYAVGSNGTILKTTDGGGALTSVMELQEIPAKYELYQNYPNPFNPETNINFYLPENAFTELKVHDVTGKKVIILVSEFRHAGNHSVKFNAGELSSGLYFYELRAGNYSSVKKMILLK